MRNASLMLLVLGLIPSASWADDPNYGPRTTSQALYRLDLQGNLRLGIPSGHVRLAPEFPERELLEWKPVRRELELIASQEEAIDEALAKLSSQIQKMVDNEPPGNYVHLWDDFGRIQDRTRTVLDEALLPFQRKRLR